ncbi:MAG: LON peptidase substrate-binding domain-containing protein [Micromonosporaceae bacterium]|jgi:hypothetical protein|nr:LON peptidase substrate-binding domain-containing protein [Micromonosporaceae bacterium]
MTARLPLFPLGTVLFPGLVLPLHVFEPRYRELVRHLLGLPAGHAREFGVVAIQRGWEVSAEPAADPAAPAASAALTLHEVGCTAEVRQVTELPDGRYDLVTVGRRRFRVARVDPTAAPYLVADVEWLPEPPGQEDVADLLAPRVLAAFRQYLGLLGAGGAGEQAAGEQLPEGATVLSHLVAATAALTVADRQQLLAAPDTATRLRIELRLLARETALLRQVRAVPVPLSELAVPPSSN